MASQAPEPPDLAGVIGAANAVGMPFVIIGGFAVIAHRYLRGTEDVDLLISGDRDLDIVVQRFLGRIEGRRQGRAVSAAALRDAETLRVASRFGPVDLLREGMPPLDFQTVYEDAFELSFHDQPARVASLASLVAFKRLANRTRDQLDLAELERIHGGLPGTPGPGHLR
jgi:hypothetical protein